MNFSVKAFILFFTVLSMPTQAMEESLEKGSPSSTPLHLIIGSVRKELAVLSPHYKKLWGEKVDLRWDERVTSLDMAPCALPGLPHTQADARLFKPAPGQQIASAYFELFPSLPIPEVGARMGEFPSEEKMRLMPSTIRNLASFMQEGSRLTIEHYPYFTFLPAEIWNDCISALVTRNPFHCWANPYLVDVILGGNLELEQQEYGTHLLKRVMSQGRYKGESAYRETLAWAIKQKKDVQAAIANIKRFLPDDFNLDARLKIEGGLLMANYNKFHEKFFPSSITEIIAVEFHRLNEAQNMTDWLEHFGGFRDVDISRGPTPTGRQNAYLIRATRNGKPLLEMNLPEAASAAAGAAASSPLSPHP